ncbi:hypothetical protein V8F20_000715 [Naviculisporaceae sp. PSN 640]
MSNKIYGLTRDHLPQRFQRFFIPGDLILFSRRRTPGAAQDSDGDSDSDTENDGIITPSSSSSASPTAIPIPPPQSVLKLNASSAASNSSSAPRPFLPTSSPSSPSLEFISTEPSVLTNGSTLENLCYNFAAFAILITLPFSWAEWRLTRQLEYPRPHVHRIDRLTAYLPQRHQQTITTWLKDLEDFCKLYSSLNVGPDRSNKMINRYISLDSTTRRLTSLDTTRDEMSQLGDKCILLRPAAYPLPLPLQLSLVLLPNSLSEKVRNLWQTYHDWRRARAAGEAFAVLELPYYESDEEEWEWEWEWDSRLEALFHHKYVEERPREYIWACLNDSAKEYGFALGPYAATRRWVRLESAFRKEFE